MHTKPLPLTLFRKYDNIDAQYSFCDTVEPTLVTTVAITFYAFLQIAVKHAATRVVNMAAQKLHQIHAIISI